VKSAEVGLLLLAIATSASAETRRFAIVLGNNAGAGTRTPLRYAESDAGKMARVLAELGDVAPDDLLLLQGRPAADLERAVVHVRESVAMVHHTPDARAVLIFYFSGHSDGESLELGGERVPYTRLKAMLAGTGAELRLAIIDACRSGSAILQKGGTPAPAFVIRLSDQLSATGEVIITSSAADESALESSEVMGSYFTHNFVSGLRGAADSSGDKLVTLAEAYRYAYDRTVTETAVTPAGAQHPVYDYRLSGQGELVLASLQRTSATLVLPEGADRALVSDLVRDQVVAEVQPGAARELALAPGSYGIKALRGGESYGGRFSVADGVRQVVKWSDLTPLKSPEFARKGGDVELSLSPEQRLDDGPWLSVFGGATRGVAQEVSVVGTLRLSLEPSAGTGFVFALVGSTGNGSPNGVSGETGFQARAGYRFVYAREPFSLFAGLEAGPAAVWQTVGANTNSGLGAIVAPRVGARLHVYGRVWAALEGELGLGLLPVDGSAWPPVLLPSANLGIAVVL
jgi:uncharacterized caspase-like protein